MAHPPIIEGTWEEISQSVREFRAKQRFRLVPLPEETSTKPNSPEPLPLPNERGLAILQAIAERQQGRRYTDPSDTPRLLKEARGGAIYGYDPTE